MGGEVGALKSRNQRGFPLTCMTQDPLFYVYEILCYLMYRLSDNSDHVTRWSHWIGQIVKKIGYLLEIDSILLLERFKRTDHVPIHPNYKYYAAVDHAPPTELGIQLFEGEGCSEEGPWYL